MKYRTDTELSNEYWNIISANKTSNIHREILGTHKSYNKSSKRCLLCLNEKLAIALFKDDNMLNKISEVISKYRHLSLIGKWKKNLDQKGCVGAVLIDLSKAFDTLNHDFLLAKLHDYRFDRDSLKVLLSYLSIRYQRTKINKSFSSWSKIVFGVSQNSVPGPLLFNIYINDLFYMTKLTDACNFADDTTFHACDSSLEDLIHRL